MTRGRSVPRKRSIKGKKQSWYPSSTTVQILLERYLHAIALWVIGILPNVNSIKTSRDVKPGTSVCSRIIRLTNKPNKKPKKKRPFPKKKRKRTTRMEWLLWILCLRWVCVSQDSELLDSQRGKQGKPDAESLGTDSKNTIHSVYATSKQVSGKRKGPSLGKIQSQKTSSAKSLRYENLRTGPKKRLKDNSDAPEARHGTLPKNICKTQRKRPGYILLARGRLGTPGCVNKEPEER